MATHINAEMQNKVRLTNIDHETNSEANQN